MGGTQTVILNIGNTHAQIALTEKGRISKSRRVATATLSARDIPSGIPVIVSSVVPAASARLKKLTPFFISTAATPWVDWSKVDASTLGADRIANVAMLATEYSLPALCIDFGTAITVEIVGPGPTFLGGSISPGRLLMRKALHDYTAQLPLLPLNGTIAPGFGANTADAMRSGIDRGAIGMVRELMEQAREQLGRDISMVAVGGDRHFFLSRLSELTDGGDDFTLIGIQKIWEHHHAH